MTSPPTNGQPDPTNYSAMDFHVLNRLRELQVAAASAFLQQDFTLAARKLEESYNLVLGQQSIAARRFHKGWQLHNWGVALLNVGEHSEGTKRIFFAYVEDALTAQVGSEDNADAELAGQTLRSTGRFGRLLDAIKDVARFYKERDVIPFTPEPIFEDALNKALMTPESVEEDIGREVAESKLSRRRTIHELHSPHDKNCFLGGAYRSGGPNLEDLRSMIAAKGLRTNCG